MTTAIKTKPGSRLAFKLTRKRIIAFLLLILGAFIFFESGSLDSDLVTTLTFESSSSRVAPTVGKIPVPTSAYLLVIGTAFCSKRAFLTCMSLR